VIYWATMTIAKSPSKVQTYPKVLAAPVLTIVAAEWLTVLQYCTSRTHRV
jgi:hypothetical protein